MIKGKKKKSGFTLTELAIAIAFISILLLTVAAVTLDMVRSYHKGVTMKSINTIGLDLIDELSSAVSESPVFDVESLCKSLSSGYDDCINYGAQRFYYQQITEEIEVKKNNVPLSKRTLPTWGMFCTGKYTYVWNTGYIISQEDDEHSMTSYFYQGGSGIGDNPDSPHFRLRKYSDPSRSLCFDNLPEDPVAHTHSYSGDYSGVDLSSPSYSNFLLTDELINTADIAIYSLTINRPVVNEISGRTLYSGSFVLGSITGDIQINEGENYSSCNFENSSTFDVEYCATNKFNFAIRAMGGNSGTK